VLPFRGAGAAPPAVPGPPKARDLARWITTDPDNLDDEEKLAQAREQCPHLDVLAGYVTESAKMLTGRHGDRLDGWMAAVEPTTSLTCTLSFATSSATTTPCSPA
jgi:hypothetical protein